MKNVLGSPTKHLISLYQPSTTTLTSYRPHTDRVTDHSTTTYRPHNDYIPTTYRPVHNYPNKPGPASSASTSLTWTSPFLAVSALSSWPSARWNERWILFCIRRSCCISKSWEEVAESNRNVSMKQGIEIREKLVTYGDYVLYKSSHNFATAMEVLVARAAMLVAVPSPVEGLVCRTIQAMAVK